MNVNVRDSRMGRAWVAMRDDESVAACAGIPIVRTKLMAYGTGAAFGGVSGAFFASYLGVVNAAQFEFSFSIFIFAMVVLGGLGSITGVVVAAIVLSVVNSYLLPEVLYDLPNKVGLAFDLSEISSGIYGAILVLVMLLRPQGLIPANKRGADRFMTGRAGRSLLRGERLAARTPDLQSHPLALRRRAGRCLPARQHAGHVLRRGLPGDRADAAHAPAPFTPPLWLDGLIAALTLGAMGAALVLNGLETR